MKKIVSIILSVAMAITVTSAFSLSVYASDDTTYTEKYYTVDASGTATLNTDVIDATKYELISPTTVSTSINIKTIEITKPSILYAYGVALNKDQKPGPIIPMPIALDYEILLSLDPNDTYLNNSSATTATDSGDFEYAKLEITQEQLNANDGKVVVTFSVRAAKYTQVPIEELGQKVGCDVHVYSLKVAPGTITADTNQGNSSLLMNGATITAPTYTVTIPEKIEFGEVAKKIKATSDEEAIAKTTDYTVSVTHSNLFDNQKNITVTLSTDNKMINGTNEIAYELYNEADTKITSGTNLFSVQPTESLVNETATKTIYATLDQREIKASGDYTGTVTFTVSMADNK